MKHGATNVIGLEPVFPMDGPSQRRSYMNTIARFRGVLTLSIFCCPMAFSQTQGQPFYGRDTCVKVREGKAQEYAAYLRDVTVKLAKVRVDAGYMATYTIAQAVAPAGRAARCDYHFFAGYDGFPPETPSAEQTAADMKKAGISMSPEAMLAKRGELSYLVGVDIWMFRERVGTPKKGGYARINYDKVHPGMTAEWAALESTGWKQLAEAASKEYGTAWRVASLAMPGGASLPYNAMTVDLFPSWAALGKGIPARALWNKVHPNRDMTAHLNRLSIIRDRPRIDTVRLIEVLTK